jgi:dienelactone hydrolase
MFTRWVIGSPQAIEIPVGAHKVRGYLDIPSGAKGIVIFALRTGRGRDRPRNQYVASVLHRAGMATLLLDLLDEHEADLRHNAFNIKLLADRLKLSAQHVRANGLLRGLPLGYFGISTGAAAALRAAADQGKDVAAIVSCAGHPNLAQESLPNVQAATLFLVAGHDERQIAIHRDAMSQMQCIREMKLVHGADHSYSEEALKEVGPLAVEWFQAHLACDRRHENENVQPAASGQGSSGG